MFFKTRKKLTLYELANRLSDVYSQRERRLLDEMGFILSKVFKEELEMFGIRNKITGYDTERLKRRFLVELEGYPKLELTKEEQKELLT